MLTELDNKKMSENITYLKLTQNKTHMGPISEQMALAFRARNLDAAANKIKSTAGLGVKINKDTDIGNQTPRENPNKSWIIEQDAVGPNSVAKKSVYMAQIWSEKYATGTEAYRDKRRKFEEARALAYSKIGINPAMDSKPTLTEGQRDIYNSMVGPFSFDYYEYHLAYKQAGSRKFIRTKTYRSLDPIAPTTFLKVLEEGIEKKQRLITITVKPQSSTENAQ
jgi:hypothetical protein